MLPPELVPACRLDAKNDIGYPVDDAFSPVRNIHAGGLSFAMIAGEARIFRRRRLCAPGLRIARRAIR